MVVVPCCCQLPQVVLGVSLGAGCVFRMVRDDKTKHTVDIHLPRGSFYAMTGTTL